MAPRLRPLAGPPPLLALRYFESMSSAQLSSGAVAVFSSFCDIFL
jgi:hypothetical protein